MGVGFWDFTGELILSNKLANLIDTRFCYFYVGMLCVIGHGLSLLKRRYQLIRFIFHPFYVCHSFFFVTEGIYLLPGLAFLKEPVYNIVPFV